VGLEKEKNQNGFEKDEKQSKAKQSKQSKAKEKRP